ncbi:MAG: hypothetical protein PUF04_09395 [bacterium]|nr:hypothetical protein [bacterium]
MAFYAEELIFGGVSSKNFGLSIYDFDSDRQETNGFQEVRTAVEETLLRRYSTYYYGSSQNSQLELTFVLGVCQDRVDENKPLSRHDLEVVSQWLTAKDGYQYLEIVQDDMREYRYRARVSAIKLVEVYRNDWGIKVTFTCDSPFAYRYPERYLYKVTGHAEQQLFSRSTYGGTYWPEIVLTLSSDTNRTVSIRNMNHAGQQSMVFENVPTSIHKIYIDTSTKVIYTDSGDDIYPYFNFVYVGLVPGVNTLVFDGNYEAFFVCEYPVAIGG